MSADSPRPLINHFLTQSLTLQGEVTGPIDDSSPLRPCFALRLRTSETVPVVVCRETAFRPLTNLDGVNRDRYARPANYQDAPLDRARLYLPEGVRVIVEGLLQRHDDAEIFEAREIHLLQQDLIERDPDIPLDAEHIGVNTERRFYFESTYWWLAQIQRMADKWLDDLFGERRDYQLSDFAELYRTHLNIEGLPTDDNVQEMATLSRFIYGLSSAYLLTGIDRYFHAAKAGVAYQREAFRGISADGRFTFWSSAKRRMRYGSRYEMTSRNREDAGTVPLYEQIYALAGLAQYYRITNDRDVLEDLSRTIRSFQEIFRDRRFGGYFSHLDYVAFNGTHSALGANRARKNWNSIGDHLPAYLVNLVLALDPLPRGRDDLAEFAATCREMLVETTDLICRHFPDANCRYVQERFHRDWTPDLNWDWQQNRAVVGHNLKISWNLTRAANYFEGLGDVARAQRCLEVADRLALDMAEHGLDPLRGGCFDCVERVPSNGMPMEFPWRNTKDFWQQEQGILAYLILHGNSRQDETVRDHYQLCARELMAFWNVFFLDRDRQGVFFRTTENGHPVISGEYAQKAGHSIAGYHSFELNYLAHIYLRSFFRREGQEHHQRFTLYFSPDPRSQLTSINVLPDFFRPGALEISAITLNGQRTEFEGSTNFQVWLDPSESRNTLSVEFQPRHRPAAAL